MLRRYRLFFSFSLCVKASSYARHRNTIGSFYHHILTALGHLTNCGNDDTIFTGDRNLQVTIPGWKLHRNDSNNISIHGYHTAVDAIRAIIDEGEGSNPCNPIAWDEGHAKGLSHYFSFKSVVEGRGVEVVKKTSTHNDEITTNKAKVCCLK